MNQNAEHEPARQANKTLKNRSRNRILRWLAICSGAGFLIFLAGSLGLFFLLWNGVNDSEALNNRIVSSINNFLGPEYEARLGVTEIRLQGGTILITSSSIKIHKSGVIEPVAVIGKTLVGTPLLSIFDDQPKISFTTMESATINLKQFPFANQSSNLSAISVNMNASLGKFGSGLMKLRERLTEGKFRRITVKNAILTGYSSAPHSEEVLTVNEFALAFGPFGKLTMKLDINAKEAKFNVTADYKKYLNGSSTFVANFDRLSASKWAKSIGIKNGLLTSSVEIKGRFDLTFNQDGSARQPVIVIQLHDNNLHPDNKTDNVKIRHAVLNFRIFPEPGRIVLEKSQIDAGNFQAVLIGMIAPVNPGTGLSGDLTCMLQIEGLQTGSLKKREKRSSDFLSMEGEFNQALRQLNIKQWNLSTVGGDIAGVASIGFGNETKTPSFELTAGTKGLSIAALKQVWPTSLATPIREWTMKNMRSGKISSASVSVSDPPEILEWLSGKKPVANNNQLVVDMKIINANFDVFGKLPPMQETYGRVQMDGKQVNITLEKGNVYTNKGKKIKIRKGTFIIPDIHQDSARAKASFIAQGQISDLATIANTPPFSVMKRLNMKPEQWSGQGEVDMVIEFPLKEKISPNEVAWHALARLEKAESSKLVTGKKISRADIVIDARSDVFVITGDVTINDIPGSVFMIKPIGKTSKAENKTTFKTRIDGKELNRFGVNVYPVISGPMNVELTSHENNGSANVKVDLKDVEISLPWINWRKGAGVPARSSFQIGDGGKLKKINNLKMSGQGFSLRGNLIFDKNGLQSFDMNRVSLNKGDDLSARIYRNGQAYTIKVDGAYFDGRALINKLFHQKKRTDRQDGITFKLSANIKQVKGFNNRIANNLILDSSIDNGWLDMMDLKTDFASSKKVTATADTKEKITSLEIHSQDAGNTLSFLNLYTRMVDGVIKSSLRRKRGSPFIGDATVENFIVIDEPKLKNLVSSKQLDDHDRNGRIKREFGKIKTNRVRFFKAESTIEAEQGYLKLNGFLAGPQIGLTYDGILYDKQNQVDLTGTFMPAFGLSKVVSVIPFIGQILSNGQDSGLIGINYHLSGPVDSPRLQLNPLSVVAPGIFKKIFQ